MSNFKDQLEENSVDCLHTVIEDVSQKYLCFTRYDDSEDFWVICVSNGCDIWRIQLDEDELKSRRELAKIASNEAFLGKIRNAFHHDEISVSHHGNKLSCTVGQGVDAHDFDLYEVTAAEKKTEMQLVLFRMAESVSSLEAKLKTANQTIEKLRKAKGSGDTDSVLDPDLKKQKGQGKAQAKQQGMSVINPGSKKRKAARGVVFD